MRLTASKAIGEIGRGGLSPTRIGGDVGQNEELARGMASAERLRHRSGLPVEEIEPIVAGIGIGLQNAGEPPQVPLGMIARPGRLGYDLQRVIQGQGTGRTRLLARAIRRWRSRRLEPPHDGQPICARGRRGTRAPHRG